MTIDVIGPWADLRNQNESSDCGNLRGKTGSIELAALAHTKKAAIVKVPPYATLVGMIWFHDALGANTTLSFDTDTQDGDPVEAAELREDTATTSAGTGVATFEPISTGAEGMYITCTQGGAGTATGTVSVTPILIYNGY